MRKAQNVVNLAGRVYEHDLVVKTVQNQESANFGKEFIAGNLRIATDDEGLNVVDVHFTFVTELTKAQAKNATYTALYNIINSGKTWMADGKDSATKVKVDTALALNDFYANDGTLVSAKRCEGGFVTIVNEIPEVNNKFKMDMVITNVTFVEADPEKNIEAPFVRVRGAVFNFRNDLLPVEFIVKNPDGMKYFEGLDASGANPIYTCLWGKIINSTVKTSVTIESAFGGSSVEIQERRVREWLITGTNQIPYEFGDEKILTAAELTKAMQDREVYLADVKRRNDEWKAQRDAAPAQSSTPIAAPAKAGGFNF